MSDYKKLFVVRVSGITVGVKKTLNGAVDSFPELFKKRFPKMSGEFKMDTSKPSIFRNVRMSGIFYFKVINQENEMFFTASIEKLNNVNL